MFWRGRHSGDRVATPPKPPRAGPKYYRPRSEYFSLRCHLLTRTTWFARPHLAAALKFFVKISCYRTLPAQRAVHATQNSPINSISPTAPARAAACGQSTPARPPPSSDRDRTMHSRAPRARARLVGAASPWSIRGSACYHPQSNGLEERFHHSIRGAPALAQPGRSGDMPATLTA